MTDLHTNSDVVAAIRARKDELGLADEFFVEKVGMSGGSYPKYFGVIPQKVMSIYLLCNVMAFLGMELSVAVNPDYQPKDCNAWEPRDERKVHPNQRVSKMVMEIARPVIFKQLSKLGNEARKTVLPPEVRSKIARTAALCRWRQHRAAIKARVIAETAQGEAA